MYIKPTKGAKSLWEIHEDMAMDALIYRVNEDIALPWDADLQIEDDKVIIVGSIVGGSANKYDMAGYCRCECSINNFSDFYRLEVRDDLDDEIVELLLSGGWVEADPRY